MERCLRPRKNGCIPVYTCMCTCLCICVHCGFLQVKESLWGRISLNPVAGGTAEPAFSDSRFFALCLYRGPSFCFFSLFCFSLQIRLLLTHQYARGLKELLTLHLYESVVLGPTILWLVTFSGLRSYSLSCKNKEKMFSVDEWLLGWLDLSWGSSLGSWGVSPWPTAQEVLQKHRA